MATDQHEIERHETERRPILVSFEETSAFTETYGFDVHAWVLAPAADD